MTDNNITIEEDNKFESLEDSDSEEDTPRNMRNMDPYLLDQLNASNHYKFTRFENS